MSPARLSPIAPSRAINTWMDNPAIKASAPTRGGPLRKNKVAPLPLPPPETHARSRSPSPVRDPLATSVGIDGSRRVVVPNPRAAPDLEELGEWAVHL
jgi:hypothetical protein